jgi:hypothetical protein
MREPSKIGASQPEGLPQAWGFAARIERAGLPRNAQIQKKPRAEVLLNLCIFFRCGSLFTSTVRDLKLTAGSYGRLLH